MQTLLLLLPCLMVEAAPVPLITCSTNPSLTGNSASVICYFPMDISESKVDFSVTQHNHNNKSVLLCNWLANGTVSCNSRDGFSLHDNQAGTNATLDIQDFQTDKQGLYMCHAIGVAEEAVEGCELTAKDPEESSSTEAFPIKASVVLYTLLFLGAACVFIIIAVCLYKKKKRHSRRQDVDNAHVEPPLLKNHTDTQHSYPPDSSKSRNERAENGPDIFWTGGAISNSRHFNSRFTKKSLHDKI